LTYNKNLEETERAGWESKCTSCSGKILYTHLTLQQGPSPFFYSNASNDVLRRKSDEEKMDELYEAGSPSIKQLETLWKNVLITAPPAPSGGEFTFWSNVRCPHCNFEFPYNEGIQDLDMRLNEYKIIVIDGAIIVGDDDCYKVKVYKYSPQTPS